MEAFNTLDGVVTPMDRANVDTDAIIPKQFLKSVKRTGFGPNLFDGWRYLDTGEPGQDHSQRPLNPDFVLNHAHYQGSSILLARANFGCGSSREHAPWALLDHGFRVVIAPSFADIFYNNCFSNGLLAIVLDEQQVDGLFQRVAETPGFRLQVDLAEQTVTAGDQVLHFDLDADRKYRLLNGLDAIGLTLRHVDDIAAYEVRRRDQAPWLFTDLAQ